MYGGEGSLLPQKRYLDKNLCWKEPRTLSKEVATTTKYILWAWWLIKESCICAESSTVARHLACSQERDIFRREKGRGGGKYLRPWRVARTSSIQVNLTCQLSRRKWLYYMQDIHTISIYIPFPPAQQKKKKQGKTWVLSPLLRSSLFCSWSFTPSRVFPQNGVGISIALTIIIRRGRTVHILC